MIIYEDWGIYTGTMNDSGKSGRIEVGLDGSEVSEL